jgi:tetratricopeptide (TPR) repeat protein
VLEVRLHPLERLAWYRTALAGALGRQSRRNEARHLIELGAAHADLGDGARALKRYEGASARAQAISALDVVAAALGRLGTILARQGEYRRALDCYEKRLDFADRVGDRRGQAATLTGLGEVCTTLHEASYAIDYYSRARSIWDVLRYRRGQAEVLTSLGNAHAAEGDAKLAASFHQQALDIFGEIGDRRGQAQALVNLGNAHRQRRNFAEAMTCFEDAKALSIKIGIPSYEGAAIDGITLVLDEQGDLLEASEMGKRIQAFYDRINDPRSTEVRDRLRFWEWRDWVGQFHWWVLVVTGMLLGLGINAACAALPADLFIPGRQAWKSQPVDPILGTASLILGIILNTICRRLGNVSSLVFNYYLSWRFMPAFARSSIFALTGARRTGQGYFPASVPARIASGIWHQVRRACGMLSRRDAQSGDGFGVSS